MKNVLVIGGGSWGTALSRLLIENGHRVYLWEYDSEIRENIKEKGENSLFLPGIKLPKELNLVNEYCEVLENIEIYSKIDVILLATPTQFLRPILKRLKNCLNYNVIIVNVAKGLEISTKKRISEVISEE